MADDLQPARPWDELIATSMRRGRTLRRRRRVLTAGPPLLLLAAAAVLAVLPGTGGLADESLVQVPVEERTPPPPVDGTQRLPQVHPLLPAGPSTSVSAGRAAGALAPHTDRRGGSAPVTVPSTQEQRAGRTVVAFSDARGDGNPSRPYGLATAPPLPGQSAASDEALDILAMEFRATEGGLRITMRLAGAHRSDARYSAYLTDRSTGCRLQVLVGGPEPDGFWNSCDASGQWHSVPNRIDPGAHELQAVLPWAALPADVSPRHVLGDLMGETSSTNPGGGTVFADDARTSQTLGPWR